MGHGRTGGRLSRHQHHARVGGGRRLHREPLVDHPEHRAHADDARHRRTRRQLRAGRGRHRAERHQARLGAGPALDCPDRRDGDRRRRGAGRHGRRVRPARLYVAGQSVAGDYGDAYATFARPIESLRLVSGLAKVGYRAGAAAGSRALFVGGDETHDYYTLSPDDGDRPPPAARLLHDEAQLLPRRPATMRGRRANLLLGVGVTHNRFHENRVEDTFDGANVDLSRRNRPQQATTPVRHARLARVRRTRTHLHGHAAASS